MIETDFKSDNIMFTRKQYSFDQRLNNEQLHFLGTKCWIVLWYCFTAANTANIFA